MGLEEIFDTDVSHCDYCDEQVETYLYQVDPDTPFDDVRFIEKCTECGREL